ncbi:MAG: hypothetical protein U5O39_17360 [Gammaproteobacteria bacterium]|nr:hypothetical protein [Gammaproteobacteria bacterium]
MIGGEPVHDWTIETGEIRFGVFEYGLRAHRFEVRLASGEWRRVALAYPTFEHYLSDNVSMGAVVGRYANRVRDGRFELGGRWIQLERNNGGHHLHGGSRGFGQRVWKGQAVPGGAHFEPIDPAGHAGYPGTLRIMVDIMVDERMVTYRYRASSDADTIVNPTCHIYFNLNGAGSIRDHRLALAATHYLPVDKARLPTGADGRGCKNGFRLSVTGHTGCEAG